MFLEMEELMEEHSFLLVELFNKLFGKIVLAIYSVFGIKSVNPEHPIPAHVVFAIIIAFIIAVFLWLIAKKPKIIPTPVQSFAETLYTMFEGIIIDIIGEDGKRYLPMIGTIGFFIFFCNVAGLFPGFESPTANLNVTAGTAVFVFLYYNFVGVREIGIKKYLRHLAGPYLWLAPLMFPIEVISHFSRPLSLSVRLFGNIMGEDMVILILASLIPYIVPLPMMALAIFTSFVQAMVFTMLAIVYLSGAVASEEH